MKYKISEIADINSKNLSKKNIPSFINYLDTANITEGKIQEVKKLFREVDDIPSRAQRIISKNDIIISTVRPNQKHYGIIKKVLPNMIASTGFAVLSVKEDLVNPKYLYYFLIQEKITSYLTGVAESSTSTFPAITPKVISDLEIELPSYDYQKKIGSILFELDSKIELNNRMNKILEQIAQVIFKQWFIDFEFPNENGEPYKSSGGEMDLCEEIGKEVPKGWKRGTVEDLGKVVGGGTPSSTKEEYYSQDGIPWITPKDLSNNKNKFITKGARDISEEGLKKSSATMMPEGTVLFTSRAPIGYIAIASNTVTTNQGFKSIIPNQNIGTSFVYYFLKVNINLIENMASGSTFKEVSGSVLKNFPALIPDENLLIRFKEVTDSFDKKIKNNENQITYLTSIRDTLLPKLMSGEIDVSQIEI